MLKAEVIETLLYGSVTSPLRGEHVAWLRTAHHQVLCELLASSADFVPTAPPSHTRRPSR